MCDAMAWGTPSHFLITMLLQISSVVTSASTSCVVPDSHAAHSGAAVLLQASRIKATVNHSQESVHSAKKSTRVLKEGLSSDAFKQIMSHLQGDNSSTFDCNLCDGGDQRWLFVLAMGRSGSTSLLQMINEIPGFRLAGENSGVLSQLKSLAHLPDRLAKFSNALAWTHGEINEQRVLCALQSYIRAIGGFLESDRVIGFKEIRHNNIEDLKFFQKLFPCARFIVNVRRNSAKHAASINKLWNMSLSPSHSEAKAQFLKTWQKEHSDRSLLMQLEDNFTVSGFNGMLSWLGVHGCEFKNVSNANVHEKYSSQKEAHMLQGQKAHLLQGQCKMD